MNLADLRTRVRDLSGVHFTEVAPDSLIDSFVNEIYQEILGVEDWPFKALTQTVATVAGTAGYVLAAPMKHVQSVAIVSGPYAGALQGVRAEDLDARQEHELEEGRPLTWALEDPRNLLFHPTPDDAYTVQLRGLLEFALLVADGDEPQFDAEYHSGLAYGAAAKLLRREGDDSGRSDLYDREVGAVVQRMRRDYLVQHEDRLIVMGGRGRRVLR